MWNDRRATGDGEDYHTVRGHAGQKPLTVWVCLRKKTQKRGFRRFSQPGAILPNGVEESGRPLDLAKEDFIGWAKQGRLPFQVGDLPWRRASVERRKPQAKLTAAVR